MNGKQFRTALTALRPGAKFAYEGDGSALDMHSGGKGERYPGLIWKGPGDPPSLAELEAKHQELNATTMDGAEVTKARLQDDLRLVLNEIDAGPNLGNLAQAVGLLAKLQAL